MNTSTNTLSITPTTGPALSRRERRERDIRRARTFFLIALMAAAVSFAGHCFTDAGAAESNDTSIVVQGR